MSERAPTRALIECDGIPAPRGWARQPWTVQRALRTRGASPELNLRIDNLSTVVHSAILPVAADLLRIASYAYGADQEISRGGDHDPTDAGWRRDIWLCIPVVEVDLWSQPEVQARLSETLHFATDDTWHFAFSRGDPDVQTLPMFDERQSLGEPDSVLLFSGGADSLCAAVAAVAASDLRPVLVSHRSVMYVSSWQQRLVAELKHPYPQWHFPHVGAWVQRRGAEAVARSRRSRAFLVASLGAAVALQLDLRRVLLADNGVVSLNLSLNGSVAGAQASRSTHPQFLHLFNRLLQVVFPAPVEVRNPQATQTRAEVLSTLKTYQCAELLALTRSCSRGHGLPAEQPHCGSCSQCVDRRFGVIAAGLEAHDPVSRYRKDIFCEALPDGDDRTVGESYLRLAQLLERTPDDELFNRFGQLFDAVLESEPGTGAQAQAVQRLLKRHAATVARVVTEMCGRLAGAFWTGEIAPSSLLGLLARMQTAPGAATPALNDPAIWQRMGRSWRLVFRGQAVLVPNLISVQYLAELLAAPDTEMFVADLITRVRGRPTNRNAVDPNAVSEALATGELRIGGQAEPDTPTERAIRATLRELDARRAEQETAQSLGETDEVDRLADEIARLEEHTTALYADYLGNKKLGEKYKRQRQAVVKAINTAIRLIGEVHPTLGQHLDRCVRRAIVCHYRADPPVHWEFEAPSPAA